MSELKRCYICDSIVTFSNSPTLSDCGHYIRMIDTSEPPVDAEISQRKDAELAQDAEMLRTCQQALMKAERERDEALAKLAALQWRLITKTDLPQEGDEVGSYFGSSQFAVCECSEVMNYKNLIADDWTHFRAINPPQDRPQANPADAGRKDSMSDTEMIDWLEGFVNECHAILLHDGNSNPHHLLGLGLRPGWSVRTLRESIAQAAQPEELREGAQ